MRYVIVGNSAAGNGAARAIRKRDRLGDILILSDEPERSYYRPLLPMLIGEVGVNLDPYRDAAHVALDAEVETGARVTQILPADRQVVLSGSRHVSYDKLLLATGAHAARPAIEGTQGPGVFVLRTLSDALAIQEAAQTVRQAVIIGGGRIGVKTALAFARRGIQVTIVEMLDRIIPQQLDQQAAIMIEKVLRDQGIQFLFGHKPVLIQHRSERVCGVALDDASELRADLVLLATGVKPNTDLAKDAAITVDRGIVVDPSLETSVPGIYAAGDVVEIDDVVTDEIIVSGLWTNAVEMGEIAGDNMAGGCREYPGAFSLLNALDIAGTPVISAGIIEPEANDEVHSDRKDGAYRKLIFRDGVLVGLLMVRDVEQAGLYTTMIREHRHVASFKKAMLEGSLSYASFVT